MKITLDLDQPLPADLIARALREATPEQLTSAAARIHNAARKTRSGGRNGGRPRKVAKTDSSAQADQSLSAQTSDSA